MAFAGEIAKVESALEKHSQDYFIFFAKQYPSHLASFPNYASYVSKPGDVGSATDFKDHVYKVTKLALEVAKDVDTPKLTAHANRLKTMPQHANVSASQIKDAYTALAGYAKSKGLNAGEWSSLGDKVFKALQQAGMQ